MTNPGGFTDAEMMAGVARTAAHMRQLTDAEDARERRSSVGRGTLQLPDGWTIHEREWSDGAMSMELGRKGEHVTTAFRAFGATGFTFAHVSTPDGSTLAEINDLAAALLALTARAAVVR